MSEFQRTIDVNFFWLLVYDEWFIGAHIAGRAAKQLKSQGKIANIIGLDPASVGFDFFKTNKRLTDSDADYVQIIHTDGDKFGFANPLGHGTYPIFYRILENNSSETKLFSLQLTFIQMEDSSSQDVHCGIN